MALGAAGFVLLLGLNFRRDISRSSRDLIWEKVEMKTLHKSVSAPGVMEAATVALLKSVVEETVVKKFAEEGRAVKPGDQLIELSRSRTQLDYDQRRNSFLNAEADYKKAVRELGLQRRLFKDQAVSESQVEEAKRTLEKAKASRDISRKELKIAEQKLESTRVRSPIKGMVLKIYPLVGDGVAPGKDLVLVGDISRFVVRTRVDELDIKEVVAGQAVEVLADAYADQPMAGVVRSVAVQAEREAFAKVEVLIDITDSHGLRLKHNLSVRVNILTEEIPRALGVPVKAILRKDGDIGRIIVRNKLGLVRERKIKLGRPAGEAVEVLSGLKPGERVGVPRDIP